MFSGLNGHGKTTLADVFLKRMFCENPAGLDACLKCNTCRYLLDEGAWSDLYRISGVEFTVDSFHHFEKHCLYAPWRLPRHVTFVDDLDLTESTVLNKLIAGIDQYNDVLMIFTVTNTGKIPFPIRQRCRSISLPKVSYESLEILITRVCLKESIAIGDRAAISALIMLADQTPRIILSGLEMIKGETGELTLESLNLPTVASNLQQLTGKFMCD